MSAVAETLLAAFSPCGAMVKRGAHVTVFRCHECVADSAAICACLLHALAHARTLVGVVRTFSASGVLIATRTNAEARHVLTSSPTNQVGRGFPDLTDWVPASTPAAPPAGASDD